MLTLNNVATQDNYVEALTLGPVATAEKIAYLVANNAAIVQVAGHSESKTLSPWGQEILITPTSGEFQRIQGMRFKSATPGAPAQIVAQLVEPGDPIPIGGTPFTQVLSPTGSITPGAGGAMVEILDSLLAAPAANWDTQTILGAAIPNIYKHLVLRIVARTDRAAVRDTLNFLFNNDSGPNYDIQGGLFNGVVAPAGENTINQAAGGFFRIPAATSTASLFGTIEAEVLNYNSLTAHKTMMGNGFDPETSGVGAGINMEVFGTVWHPAAVAAVSRLLIASSTGSNLVAGSRFTLYGLL